MNPPSLVSSDFSSSPPRLTGRNPVFTSVFRVMLPTSGGHDLHISSLQKRIKDTPATPSPERIFSHGLLRLEDLTLP
ncbi:hypothetical protein TNCT_408941 [Trichonephila clavata]|uniref:Uncharacterized protein n=1 Tax=Trichonephila clavata TaxID=2740835 RepID=A0A8X6LJ57_TRICU|nr:hypothetical protein TNCT_408941 [Trichonephila clavata]